MDSTELGGWARKSTRALEEFATQDPLVGKIVDEIAPIKGELVISKDKPSVFFGTCLTSHLVQLGLDSLLVCGCTTSGCVRATVIDAFSYNYKLAVIEEGVFDRGEVSHAINLFDMNAKYADVISLEEAMEYLNNL